MNIITRGRATGPICAQPVVSPHKYCLLCLCESKVCGSARRAREGHRRWCTLCAASRRPGPHEYANGYGVHSYRKNWDLALKVSARLSFLLRFVWPDDVQAFTDMCKSVDAQPGACIPGTLAVVLFLGNSLKWPAGSTARHASDVSETNIFDALAAV